MSEYPNSATSDHPPKARVPAGMTRALVPSGLTFAAVFGLFLLYAFLAPATYRTSALVQVDEIKGEGQPEPLELSRKLHEAALDRQLLEGLARLINPESSAAERAESARVIRSSTEIDSADGRNFSVSFTDSDGDRAEVVCNQIANRVAERLPRLLATKPATSPVEVERQKRTELLMAFVAAHPEVLNSAPEAAPGEPKKADEPKKAAPLDPAMNALQVERDRVARELTKAEAGARQPAQGSADNPYAEEPSGANPYAEEPSGANPEQLRQRLREIDKSMAARKQALLEQPAEQPVEKAPAAAKTAAAAASPEVREQWKALVQSLAQLPKETPAEPAAELKARVLSRAEAPAWPIHPNRGLLLLLGAALGLLSGAASAFVTLRAGKPSSRRAPVPAASPLRTRDVVVNLPVRSATPSAPPAGMISAPPAPLALPPVGGTGSYPPEATAVVETTSSSSPPPPDEVPSEPASGAPVSEPPPPAEGGEPFGMSSSVPPGFDGSEANASFKVPPPKLPSISPNPPLAYESRAPNRTSTTPGTPSVQPPAPNRTSTTPGMPSVQPPAPNRTSTTPGMPSVRPPAPDSNVIESDGESVDQPPPAIDAEAVRLKRGMRRTPKTLVMGSVIEPVHPSAPPHSSAPPPSSNKERLRETGYSHVSSPPADESKALVHGKNVPGDWRPAANLAFETHRELCGKLFSLALDQCFVVAVSAPSDASDAKSRLAAELALALAESRNPRVLLLEGNLNRPAVHRQMRVDVAAQDGLSRQLQLRAQGKQSTAWTVTRCTDTLDVLGEGFMRSPGLILTAQFEQGLTELKSYYVGSSRVDLQACKLEYSIVSPK